MNNNALLSEAYYTAMKEKNIIEMEKYLDRNVQLVTPLAGSVGKEAAIHAANNLFALLNTLIIRARFDSEDQAMLAIDLDFIPPIGKISIASLMTFKNNLIIKIELFYDPRKIITKKDEIFS